MERKPIIGIVGRGYLENDDSIIKLNEEYRLAIIKSGGIPFMILPTNDLKYVETLPRDAGYLTEKEKEDLYQVLALCDGFLMPGGSRWYQYDEVICKYALEKDIPTLGICLGMQILGSVDNFCGTQNSDKTIKNVTSINHCQEDEKYVHECIIQDKFLYDILKVDKIKINSRHHYHITKKDYFSVDAYSEDGLIEAIHIPNHKFALGVQWHPESMISYEPVMLEIFKALIHASLNDC